MERKRRCWPRHFFWISVDEDAEGDGDGEGDEDGDAKAEYVKKEYFARPYESPYGTLEDVEKSIVSNSRPLMAMRITK